MSFIFQRVSDKRVSSSSQSLGSRSSIFDSRRPMITNAKSQSQLQWKMVIFKSLNCFVNVVLVLNVFFLSRFTGDEDQELLLYVSTLLSACSGLFYLFGVANERALLSRVYHQKNQLSWALMLKISSLFIFYLLHPNCYFVGVDVVVFETSYNVNAVLEMLIISRILLVVAFLVQMTRFYGLRVARVREIYALKERFSFGFAIRCLFRQNSFRPPLFMLIFGLALISFIYIQLKKAMGETTDFVTEIYETMIAMTTVGYGDIELTHQSERLKTVFVVILGSFVSSMLTLTVLSKFKLTQAESKSYTIFNRLKLQQKMQSEKKRIVGELFLSQRSKSEKIGSFYKDLVGPKLTNYKKGLKQYELNDSFYDFFIKNHQELTSSVKKLVEKQLMIKNLMNFYIERRMKMESEWSGNENREQVQSKKSHRSFYSKNRVEDSTKLMKYFKMIVNAQQSQ